MRGPQRVSEKKCIKGECSASLSAKRCLAVTHRVRDNIHGCESTVSVEDQLPGKAIMHSGVRSGSSVPGELLFAFDCDSNSPRLFLSRRNWFSVCKATAGSLAALFLRVLLTCLCIMYVCDIIFTTGFAGMISYIVIGKLSFTGWGLPHFSTAVRLHLDMHFLNQWIGRGDPRAWPSRSPDFWLRGHIKSMVCTTPLDMRDELIMPETFAHVSGTCFNVALLASRAPLNQNRQGTAIPVVGKFRSWEMRGFRWWVDGTIIHHKYDLRILLQAYAIAVLPSLSYETVEPLYVNLCGCHMLQAGVEPVAKEMAQGIELSDFYKGVIVGCHLSGLSSRVIAWNNRGNWTLEQWKSVLWSDESRFTLFRSDGRVWVWRLLGERLLPEYIVPTRKFGGGGVMVWGYFTAFGVGPLGYYAVVCPQQCSLIGQACPEPQPQPYKTSLGRIGSPGEGSSGTPKIHCSTHGTVARRMVTNPCGCPANTQREHARQGGCCYSRKRWPYEILTGNFKTKHTAFMLRNMKNILQKTMEIMVADQADVHLRKLDLGTPIRIRPDVCMRETRRTSPVAGGFCNEISSFLRPCIAPLLRPHLISPCTLFMQGMERCYLSSQESGFDSLQRFLMFQSHLSLVYVPPVRNVLICRKPSRTVGSTHQVSRPLVHSHHEQAIHSRTTRDFPPALS
ncbi:hypothetical protein PR048_013181 [Dryococelus australis]|uniref:Uncharacterized protein n=1 Tax=Dryococelus australis TaxID=614101 RepID=A0ABQ9HRE2_9NEOP|nr:hypothetical protein PR048_013181 [Dryococelus australis]